MSILQRLQVWFTRHCDGEWEHHSGISIQSCDNPGWWIKVNLAGTPLVHVPFSQIDENVDEHRFPRGPQWFCCHVNDGIWNGAGDENSLERILATFLDWAENGTNNDRP